MAGEEYRGSGRQDNRGNDPGADLEQARQTEALFAGPAVVVEAELAMQGLSPVTVMHGPADGEQGAHLIGTVLPELADRCGPPQFTRGGTDFTTYLFTSGAPAQAFTDAIEALPPPSWWRVLDTALPAWTRDIYHRPGDPEG
jgi:hypothetical protein